MSRGGSDVLDDVALEQIIRHAVGLGCRVEILLAQVVAIPAIQIANCPNRFRHYLEFAGGNSHVEISLWLHGNAVNGPAASLS